MRKVIIIFLFIFFAVGSLEATLANKFDDFIVDDIIKPEVDLELDDEFVEEDDEFDLRGVWLCSITNDAILYTDEESYKLEIDFLVETLLKNNINSLFYQVRPTLDALYKSDINPTSIYLYGYGYNQNDISYPDFDPFLYLVDTMNENNIDVHAWINPYRVSLGSVDKDSFLANLSDLSFAKNNEEFVLQDATGKLQLNPGYEEVREHIVLSVLEIVDNYDVAGIHMDDYFYPYATFDDTLAYTKNKLDEESVYDFRRRSVNELVYELYSVLNDYDVSFGISPFGIWDNSSNQEEGSNTSGMTSYNTLYADSRLWVLNEWVDYIAPQIYFAIANPYAPYEELVSWWSEQCKDSSVKLYLGCGVYQFEYDYYYNNNDSELIDQFIINENYIYDGNILFSYQFLLSNNQIIIDNLEYYINNW